MKELEEGGRQALRVGRGGWVMERCVGALLARLNLLIRSGGSDERERES